MKQNKHLAPLPDGTKGEPQELTTEVTMRYEKAHPLLQSLTRLFVSFFASLGINCLIADALRLESNLLIQILPLLYWLAVLALFFHSKKGFLGGLTLLTAGFGGIWLITDQNPIRYLASGIALIWNRFMTIIDSMGYMSLSPIGEGLPLTEESLFFTLSLISCLVFFLSVRKKTGIFPILVYLLLICSPIFIYNMPDRNDGIALLAAALVGITVMRLSEKHSENPHSSGFVGATALLLAFLLLLTPMLTVKEPWGDIPGIAEKIEELRIIITDLAEGKTPDLPFGDGFESYNTPRSTVATKRQFKGQTILTAYSDINTPLYLREWVGGNYRNNSWYMPELFDVEPQYRPLTPEYIVNSFLNAYHATTGKDGTGIMGLSRGTVAVRPQSVGSLIPIPVTPLSKPLIAAGFEDTSLSYLTHSDFIYSSSTHSRKIPYEVMTVLPYRYTTDAYDEFVEAFYRYVLYTQDGILPEEGTLAYRMAEKFGKDALEKTVTASLAHGIYAETLYGSPGDSSATDHIVEEIFKTTDIAKYYNLSSYGDDLDIPSHTGVINVDGKTYYLSSLGEVIYADEVARLVADFLGSRCRYTLEPKDATVSDAMEEFLFYGKEGYCVQFATASTLIMRRLGFTARYAEGYIAKDFTKNSDKDFSQPYASNVKDYNAHAWMEIWVSGFGWKTVEVTPGYTEDFYEAGGIIPDDTDDPFTAGPEDTKDPFTTDPDHTDDPSSTTDPGVHTTDPDDTTPVTTATDTDPIAPIIPIDLTPWLLGLSSAAVLILAVFLLIRRSIRRRTAKEQRIRLARKGCPATKRQELAAKLADDVSAALRAYGLVPKVGERPSAFGQRADLALTALKMDLAASRAVEALSRLVYGGLAEEEDLIVLAAVTDTLMKQAKRRLGFIRFLYYRWIVCTV